MYLNKRIIFGWLLLGGLFAGACGEDEPAPAAEPLDLSIRAALAPVLTADGTASVEECRMEWSAGRCLRTLGPQQPVCRQQCLFYASGSLRRR